MFSFSASDLRRSVLFVFVEGTTVVVFLVVMTGLVGLIAAVGGCMVGLILGVTSGYLGGTFDLIFQRITDIWLAFPSIILALTVIVAFGTGMENVILAIAIALVPGHRETRVPVRHPPRAGVVRP